MTPLRANLAASFAGVASTTVVQLVCVPFFVKLLGVEGYALVGFSATLQLVLVVFELGLTPTLNRELARLSTQPGSAARMRSFSLMLELANRETRSSPPCASWARPSRSSTASATLSARSRS